MTDIPQDHEFCPHCGHGLDDNYTHCPQCRELLRNIIDCPTCGGSGFSGYGTGYGDVCGDCIAGKVLE